MPSTSVCASRTIFIIFINFFVIPRSSERCAVTPQQTPDNFLCLCLLFFIRFLRNNKRIYIIRFPYFSSTLHLSIHKKKASIRLLANYRGPLLCMDIFMRRLLISGNFQLQIFQLSSMPFGEWQSLFGSMMAIEGSAVAHCTFYVLSTSISPAWYPIVFSAFTFCGCSIDWTGRINHSAADRILSQVRYIHPQI